MTKSLMSDLKGSLADELRQMFQALATNKTAAAGGDTLAAANIKPLTENIEQTTRAFRSLNDLLGDQGKRTKERGKEEEESKGLFVRGLREMTRGTGRFVNELLPIPHSLGQLVRQSANTGNTGLGSTLDKSWQLVLMQIQGVFAPAILRASRGLQEFANDVKGAKGIADVTGKGLRTIGRTFGGTDEHGREKGEGNWFGNILHKAGEGWRDLDQHIFGGAERDHKTSQDALAAAAERSVNKQGRHERSFWEKHGQLPLAPGQQYKAAPGAEGYLERIQRTLIFGQDKGILEKNRRDLHEAKRKDKAEWPDLEAAKKVAEAARREQQTKSLSDFMRRSGLTEKQAKAKYPGLYGDADSKTRKPGMAHDILPPNYGAAMLDFGSVRDQAQMKALNMTTLDQKLMLAAIEQQTEYLRIVAENTKDRQELPSRD